MNRSRDRNNITIYELNPSYSFDIHRDETASLTENEDREQSPEPEREEETEPRAGSKRKVDIQELGDEWMFDCVCGMYGQIDDGKPHIECENCRTWQHQGCVGVKETQAEDDAFSFVSSRCRDAEEVRALLPGDAGSFTQSIMW